MTKVFTIFLVALFLLEMVMSEHGDHDHHDHDHHDHDHHGWGRNYHDHGDGGSGRDMSHIRPLFGRGGYFGGGGGGGLFGRLFGWRRRGYYNQGYYQGYPNYGFCRLSQFVDYVGRVPRFYCDCPPYPPNYQWNQCSPMYG
ncbi:hypothetical protein L5515_006891 [Caenorhabditis briggsae]|uniref:Uncharacterized protein n=2 Tax=Caenorhabditis briggsae TaxID=6238 RepID=A0AAE9F331_CAEBR|nr:hypothetical protein L5515_006891 [Caenorhabditis briggsae]